MEKLKPCPFCGKDPGILLKHVHDDRYFMQHFCVNRDVTINIDLRSADECARIWNTRAGAQIKFSKEKKYVVNGRIGQYELTTNDGKFHCFFMDDTDEYDYFEFDAEIKEMEGVG
jgi:hypothetical protein